MTTLLMTGATGFAGRCLVETVLKETDWEIISLQRGVGAPNDRLHIIQWDFCEPMSEENILSLGQVKYFVHLGANVHALKSLVDPGAFVRTNVDGTLNVLEVARRVKPELFLYMSTAEVFGGRDEGYSAEGDQLKPSNPYAASKAAGELLTYSYFRSFQLPTVICRTMNLYGPGQNDLSKFVPMVQDLLSKGQPIKIHVNKNGVPGVRQWLTGNIFAARLIKLLRRAEPGNAYHLVGEMFSNVGMAELVAAEMGIRPKFEFVQMPITHCWRYAIKSTR